MNIIVSSSNLSFTGSTDYTRAPGETQAFNSILYTEEILTANEREWTRILTLL